MLLYHKQQNQSPLDVNRSWALAPLHGELVLSEVHLRACSNLDILGALFDSKVTFEVRACNIVSRVSQ